MESKKIVCALIVTALVFAAAIGNLPGAGAEQETYYLFDRTGDHLLISQGNDIYIQTLDGVKERRITESIDVLEKDAFFSGDGRYVLYMVDRSRYFAGVADIKIQYFLQPLDGDRMSTVEITEEVYRDFKKERMASKHAKAAYLNLRRYTEEEETKEMRTFIGGKDEEEEKKE